MDRALFHAARGLGRTSPNPAVGAVVVSPSGVVVGQGHHARAGEPHAEIHALRMAGELARGSTLYCTLEPCSHWGRTGPCVDRILKSGVTRVVAAIEDPNPLVRGRGFARLRDAGVVVDVGTRAAEARALNEPYFTLIQSKRPFVILKAAMSLDGCIARARGERTRLTSAAADRHAHRVRAEVDAIGVGAETVVIDDPWLTVRGVYRARPLTRVIFDRRLRTPPAARVLSTHHEGPVIIVTTAEGVGRSPAAVEQLEAQGAQIEVVEGQDFGSALARLGKRSVGSLLLEGGAAIQAAAWRADLVDFVRLYVTPTTIGPSGVPFLDGLSFSTAMLQDRCVEPLGPDTLIEGYVHRPH
jgi:diaminohydroxyphosphoribosylaminopyrimidine deaminase/5-amino-6-(5-phosphoribosylamino)uracil reductase